MNMTNNGSHYGFTQYCWPLDYELSGRTFSLRAENAEYKLAFRDRGLDVPGNISVVGFNGVSYVRFLNPRLATIRQDTAMLARKRSRLQRIFTHFLSFKGKSPL